SDAGGVVNSVRHRSRHRANAGFTEAFYPKEPSGLEAVDEYLSLVLGNIHDRRQTIRKISDAVVARARELSIPRNGFGSHLNALYQRTVHIRFTNERIDHQSDVMTINRSQHPPVASPCIYFDLNETCAYTT